MKLEHVKNDVYYFCHRLLWLFCDVVLFQTLRRIVLLLCGAKISNDTTILLGVRIICPWRLSLGSGSTINSNCLIDARGHIYIGNNVQIGYGSSVHSMGHKYYLDNFPAFKSPVHIGDNVVIYPKVFINPGSTIEENVVVHPGSVVRGVLAKNGVYAGNPIVQIGSNNVKNSSKSYPSIFGF